MQITEKKLGRIGQMSGINKFCSRFLLSLLFVHISVPSYAQVKCKKKVQVIDAGDKAPCDGFLFSDSAELEARDAIEDNKYYLVLIPKLEKRIELGTKREEILEKRLDLYIKQSQTLAEQKVRSDNRKTWERIGFFFLGALAVYGGAKVVESTR